MAVCGQGLVPLSRLLNLRNLLVIGSIVLLFTLLMKKLRSSRLDIRHYFDIRKCQELRLAYENTRVKRLVTERRVEDHFAFFCLNDTVDTCIPHKYLSVANGNESASDLCNSCCGYFVFMAVSASITFVIATCFFKFGAIKPRVTGVLDLACGAVLVLLFVLAGIGIKYISSKLMGEQSSRESEIKELSRALRKEEKSYGSLLKSLEHYHALEENIRHDIRTSERFSSLVREKILAGVLTASCCERIAKELEHLKCEQEHVTLYA